MNDEPAPETITVEIIGEFMGSFIVCHAHGFERGRLMLHDDEGKFHMLLPEEYRVIEGQRVLVRCTVAKEIKLDA